MDEREQVKSIMEDLTGVVERSMINLGVATTIQLYRATRKDTTWASRNWIPSIGRHRSNPVGRRTVAGVRAAASAQAAGIERIRAYTLGRKGRVIFVVNNVPYIGVINDVYDPGYVGHNLVLVASRTAVGAAA